MYVAASSAVNIPQPTRPLLLDLQQLETLSLALPLLPCASSKGSLLLTLQVLKKIFSSLT